MKKAQSNSLLYNICAVALQDKMYVSGKKWCHAFWQIEKCGTTFQCTAPNSKLVFFCFQWQWTHKIYVQLCSHHINILHTYLWIILIGSWCSLITNYIYVQHKTLFLRSQLWKQRYWSKYWRFCSVWTLRYTVQTAYNERK